LNFLEDHIEIRLVTVPNDGNSSDGIKPFREWQRNA
jgi:hypothetical protein